MTINETYQEIQSITLKLIELGLSIKQHWAVRSGHSICCKEDADVSGLLRNISYQEKYDLLNTEDNYNFKLIDGAVIQLMYTFNHTGREILSHRLAYFPAPNIENYEDDPESHENYYYGESEFHDLIDKNVIKIPLRFDYSPETPPFVDIHHPYAHLHLGEYESCRIPIVRPLTPAQFINFILRNFYNTALREYCSDYTFPMDLHFNNSITENERNLVHIGIR